MAGARIDRLVTSGAFAPDGRTAEAPNLQEGIDRGL